MVRRSAEDGLTAVRTYENFKRSHLDTETACQEEGVNFIPLICEANGGGWGPAAQAVWSELAKYKSTLTGEPHSITASHLLQSLGLILHNENARAILRRSSPNYSSNHFTNSIGYNELLAASAACGTFDDL